MIYILLWILLKFFSLVDVLFGYDRYLVVYKVFVVVIYFILEFFFDLFIFCDK